MRVMQLRREVAAFAALMEAQLQRHDYRRGLASWRDGTATAADMADRAYSEAGSILPGVTPPDKPIAKVAANIGNYAMMAADLAGQLPDVANAIDLQLGGLMYDAMTDLLSDDRAVDVSITFDIHGEPFALTVRRDLQDAGPADAIPTRKHEDGWQVNDRLAAIADQVVPEYRADGASYSCTGHVAHKWNAAYEAAARALGVQIKFDGKDFVLSDRKSDEPDQPPHFDMIPVVDESGSSFVRMVALDTWQRNDEATYLRLQLEASNDVSPEQVAAWTDEQCKEADVWAWSVHMSAGDHDDVIVPSRPAFIPQGADRYVDRNIITGEPLTEADMPH